MVKGRAITRAAPALACLLFTAILRAEGDDPKGPAQSPLGILVHSKDGSDSLQGFCKEQGRYVVCDVTEIRILGPDIKRVDEDERNMLREFKKDPDKAKKDLSDTLASMKETTAT